MEPVFSAFGPRLVRYDGINGKLSEMQAEAFSTLLSGWTRTRLSFLNSDHPEQSYNYRTTYTAAGQRPLYQLLCELNDLIELRVQTITPRRTTSEVARLVLTYRPRRPFCWSLA